MIDGMLKQEADVKITPAATIQKNSILEENVPLNSPHRKETAMLFVISHIQGNNVKNTHTYV